MLDTSVIRKMQTKSTMRHHYMLTRLAKLERLTISIFN